MEHLSGFTSLPAKALFGTVLLKCSQRCCVRTMSDSAQKCIPLIQNLILLSWVLIWPNHLWGSSELESPPPPPPRVGAELGFITMWLVLARFSVCSIWLPLYSLAPRRRARERRAGSSALHIIPRLQFVIFQTRWSLLWNEMSFLQMKRHKSSVINLLVRLLQLSPVEDIWTADWLMPAVRLEHGDRHMQAAFQWAFKGATHCLK